MDEKIHSQDGCDLHHQHAPTADDSVDIARCFFNTEEKPGASRALRVPTALEGWRQKPVRYDDRESQRGENGGIGDPQVKVAAGLPFRFQQTAVGVLG